MDNEQWTMRNYPLSLTQQPLKHSFGGLAQLARATALQAVGQRFDSVILHISSP